MAESSPVCFHCGLPNPAASRFYVKLDGGKRRVCCIGCQAVAQLIHASGLDNYYALRTGTSGLQPAPPAGDDDAFVELDAAPILDELAQRQPNGDYEISIHVEGMYCAACAWLLETQLTRLTGVRSLAVSLMSSRLRIRWQPDKVLLSALLQTIARLGYEPRPTLDGATAPQTEERRRALKRLFVAGIGMMQVMMFAVSLYAGAFHGMSEPMLKFFRLLSLVVATPVVLYSARPFFRAAWRGVRTRRPGMDLPVAIAIGLAFLASIVSTVLDGEDVWFDSVVMFVFFLSLARYIEMSARQRATARAHALAQLLPSTTTRLEDGVPQTVALSSLRTGDHVLLRPGDNIPADGRVIDGSGDIDEALLTGESAARFRTVGDRLIAGSINTNGTLTLDVRRVGDQTVLATIGAMLDKAMSSRPRQARVADRLASYIVIALLIVAIGTAIVWSVLAPERAFEVTLAVLVVTCPCALALATPAALAAAAARLSELGFLITDQGVIETLAAADSIVFDKTGTLTTGRPVIQAVHILSGGDASAESHYLAVAAALESRSAHPIAAAFAHVSSSLPIVDAETVPGSGIAGRIDGSRWRIGHRRFVAPGTSVALPVDSTDNVSAVYLGHDDELVARFALRDELRDDGARAIAALERQGLVVSLASGDTKTAVRSVAKRLGIRDYHANLTPAAKLDLLQDRQARGQTVVMVGDGVNDAPVLAGADTSIAMAGGAMLARANAGAVLLGGSLLALPQAIAIARQTSRVVGQNLTWAALYNLAAVPLAASGHVPPWLAAIGMSTSSLIVVLNALRLRHFRPAESRTDDKPHAAPPALSLPGHEATP